MAERHFLGSAVLDFVAHGNSEEFSTPQETLELLTPETIWRIDVDWRTDGQIGLYIPCTRGVRGLIACSGEPLELLLQPIKIPAHKEADERETAAAERPLRLT